MGLLIIFLVKQQDKNVSKISKKSALATYFTEFSLSIYEIIILAHFKHDETDN